MISDIKPSSRRDGFAGLPLTGSDHPSSYSNKILNVSCAGQSEIGNIVNKPGRLCPVSVSCLLQLEQLHAILDRQRGF